MPACCCGGTSGPPPPKPGPAGEITGDIQSPSGVAPSALAVYAVYADSNVLNRTPYLVTRVTPPSTTYQILVPPGDYAVVARLDADPLSAAGYAACTAEGCGPNLAPVRVEATQTRAHIDISSWGSQAASDVLWRIDTFGTLMPLSEATPSPATSPSPLPVRQRPHGPTPALPEENDLASYYSPGYVIRLDLPAGWKQIRGGGQLLPYLPYYFASEDVASPLSLDTHGVFLIVQEQGGCLSWNFNGVDAEASFFNTPQGMAHFYFRDHDGSPGSQPFVGSQYLGTKDATGSCLFFKFSGATTSARDSNLLTFDQIVFQARYGPA